MTRTGHNTGNIFFVDALRRQLRHTDSEFGSRFDPKVISESYDYIAIPAANWIAAGNTAGNIKVGRLAKLIEQTSLPCLIAGLGVQSLDTRTVPNLSGETRQFLKAISEHSKVVGVRGPYTLHVLEHYGVENAVVAGCPSYFWGLSPKLQIEKRETSNPIVAVNGSRKRKIGRKLNSKKHDVERALYAHAFSNEGSFVVPQTEEFEIHMGLGAAVSDIPRGNLDSFKEFFDPEMRDSEIEELRYKFRVFTRVEDWMTELSRVDFVLGTRLHGCLMGLAAGIPALLITIDSRTRELAEYLKVPTVPIQDLAVPFDVNRLYEQVELGETLIKYPERFAIYREFLEANGVDHNLIPSDASRAQVPIA